MFIPVLLTAGILGTVYYFGRAPTGRTEPKPDTVIPREEIPTTLQMRMERALIAVPQPYQNVIPPNLWGDPAAWTGLAQTLNTAFPGNPQSPELNAIAIALRSLSFPAPAPLGPVPIPPLVGDQLQSVLNGLLAQTPALPANVFPFPTTNSMPPRVVLGNMVDPNTLTTLAQQIEMFLPGRAEPGQLRAIAAQLRMPAIMGPIMEPAAMGGPWGAYVGCPEGEPPPPNGCPKKNGTAPVYANAVRPYTY